MNIIECPNCFHRMEMTSMLDEDLTHVKRPVGGDFTLCACCGEFLRFEDKDVHIATEDEFNLMDPIRKTMALLAQQLVRSEDYQKQFKAVKLGKRR